MLTTLREAMSTTSMSSRFMAVGEKRFLSCGELQGIARARGALFGSGISPVILKVASSTMSTRPGRAAM